MRICNYVLSLLIGLGLAGCGNADLIWVKGTLNKGGTMYKPPEGRKVAIYFYQTKGADGKDMAGEAEQAEYNANDGTFSVSGREGSGIPKGTYRIAITETMDRETFDKLKEKTPKSKSKRGTRLDDEKDFLEQTFGAMTSPFVRELKKSITLVLDMEKP